jgi:hypothetical protein
MSGSSRRDDVSFYPARSARQAVARHRRIRSPDPGTAADIRPLDGPLTTGEMLRGAAELDAGWVYSWMLVSYRDRGEVPTAPLDADTAYRLLPVELFGKVGANLDARNHKRTQQLATGIDPPDVLPPAGTAGTRGSASPP